MRGLKAKGSFVGNGKVITGEHKNSTRKILVMLILLSVFITSSVVFVAQSHPLPLGNSTTLNYRSVNTDIGKAYKQPTVCYGGYFVVAYYNDSGYLNVTSINPSTGNQVQGFPKTISTDVDKYRRTAIASDGAYGLIVWRLNSNHSLYGQFLNGTGFPDPTRPAFQINDSATTVGSTDFDVVGITNQGAFVVVWSDSSYHNHYLVIKDSSPVQMGSVGSISSDTNSHARNQIGYDPTSGNVMVVWRRYNSSGIYNITGRVFSVNINTLSLSPATGDLTIASGMADNTYYDYPSIAGGNGYFFVGYTDDNSPYNISGRIIGANDGSMTPIFKIDSTGSYGRSFLGIAYNGTDFVVTWTNSNYDIVARNYDTGGNPTTNVVTIAGTSDNEETQDVAYAPSQKTYYFVWYDYSNKHDYGSLWTESEYIPEFTWILPVISVVFAGVFLLRRKH